MITLHYVLFALSLLPARSLRHEHEDCLVARTPERAVLICSGRVRGWSDSLTGESVSRDGQLLTVVLSGRKAGL
jgi:hypothetical protein